MIGRTQVCPRAVASKSLSFVLSPPDGMPLKNIPGNYYDKYNTSNPVAKFLMDGFLSSFDSLVAMANAKRVYEVGCGEGYLSSRLLDRGMDVRGSDLELVAVEEANLKASRLGHGQPFSVRSLYDLCPSEAAADLVVCCEVLEHLSDPNAALRVLSRLASPYLLVSVPREPIWRLLNVARGTYLTSFGNTPGHVQHWSSGSFTRLLQRYLEIVEIRHPLPWTMALCRAPN